MKRILDYIEQKKSDLAQTPFMTFVANRGIAPRLRLGFAPCIAPFVMSFGDLNKYVLRDEASPDKLQGIINVHSRVDDHHWRMFLRDVQQLDLNAPLDLVGALTLLWSEDCKRTRQLTLGLSALISRTAPLLRMVIVEAIEATGNVAFERFQLAAADFEAETGRELYYFGAVHYKLETGHAMGTENVEAILSRYSLTAEQEAEARALVDRVFELFTAMFAELLAYCRRRASEMGRGVPAWEAAASQP